MSTATEILARMIEAKQMMGSMPPIQASRRMHPDDINAPRRQFGSSEIAGPFTNLFGVKIIPDESAERLPRTEL